jgi:hypothetical protein
MLSRPLLGAVLWALLLGLTPARSSAAAGSEGLEARLARVEALLAEARFREVAEQAPALRRDALAMQPSPTSRRLLVRAELMAGTAALALRQENAARLCFQRALQLDPSLALGEGASPKLRRAFDAARGAR